MKLELNLSKWGQALRTALLIVALLVLQLLVIREAVQFGVNLVLTELKQQQTQRTGVLMPIGATEANSLATSMDSRHTD